MRLKDVDLPRKMGTAVINRMAHSGGKSWARWDATSRVLGKAGRL